MTLWRRSYVSELAKISPIRRNVLLIQGGARAIATAITAAFTATAKACEGMQLPQNASLSPYLYGIGALELQEGQATSTLNAVGYIQQLGMLPEWTSGDANHLYSEQLDMLPAGSGAPTPSRSSILCLRWPKSPTLLRRSQVWTSGAPANFRGL